MEQVLNTARYIWHFWWKLSKYQWFLSAWGNHSFFHVLTTHSPPPAPLSEHRNSNNHVSQNNCRCWGPKVCWARNYLFDRVEQSLRQSGLPYIESYSLQVVSFSVLFRQVKCYKVFLMAVLNKLPLLPDTLRDWWVLLWMCLKSIKIMLISDIKPYKLWDVTVLVHANESFNNGL